MSSTCGWTTACRSLSTALRGSRRTDSDTFLALVSGRTDASDAIEAGRLDIEGDAEALARAGEIFGLATGLPPA
jgi:hypothetical protein